MARKRKDEQVELTAEERQAVAAIEEFASEALKPGRPAGSVSAAPATVRCRRAGCIKCGSAKLSRRAVVREMAHAVKHPDGVVTSLRRWQRAMCKACGQWQTIIEDYNP